MSSFTKELVVSPEPDGRKWRLKEDFEYYTDLKHDYVKIPKEFLTDFASIPRIFWIFLPPYQKLYGKAAIVHDYLCIMAALNKRLDSGTINMPGYKDNVSLPSDKNGFIHYKLDNEIVNRYKADRIFLEAMNVNAKTKIDKFKAKIMFWYVRLYAFVLRKN